MSLHARRALSAIAASAVLGGLLIPAAVGAAAGSVPILARSSMQPVTVMTYNVLEADRGGRHEGDGVVAPWSQRKPVVVRFIQQAQPDVIAVQEAAAWVAGYRGPRQIDDLAAALGGDYGLADTEIPPSQRYYHRTADYILYRRDAFAAVGQAGHWTIGLESWGDRFAAYQVLRDRTTGATFLFVCTHLLVRRGHTEDLHREVETRHLINDARSYARDHGNLPVVYAGDYNSDRYRHSPDGPSVVMKNAGIAKTSVVAQHRANARYNTANGYQRRPPRSAAHIDDVFVSRGIAVHSWRELLHVAHGQQVGVIASDHNPVVTTLGIPY